MAHVDRAQRGRITGVLLVLACSSFAWACGSTESPEAPQPPPSALEREIGAPWNVVTDPRSGTVIFAEPREPGPSVLTGGGAAAEAALRFLETHRAAFLLRAPREDLVMEAEGADGLGLRWVSFTPRVDGELVMSERLSVHFDDAGAIAFVSGRYASVSAGPAPGETKTAARLASAAVRPPCLHLDGSGRGVHFYAAPPLHDASDQKRFLVTAGAAGGYEMRRAATASSPALACHDPVDFKVITSTSLEAWDTEGSDAGAAVDAYFHAGKVLEFYRTKLGRASYDGANAPLIVQVHTESGGASYAEGVITFSQPPQDRPSPRLSYAGAFDAVAHEFQHGVTATTLRFADGSGEDGADSAILDESFSDVFAAFAEHWLKPGDANVTLAEDVAAPGYPPTRDMAHPSRCLDVGCTDDCGHRACPDHLSRLDPLTDPHRSTGISSNAWFLMTVGGTNDTSKSRVDEPLGWETSLRLWYALVVSRAVAPDARFADVALASVALARHAAGGELDLTAVACAWVAVGVIDRETASRFWDVQCAVP